MAKASLDVTFISSMTTRIFISLLCLAVGTSALATPGWRRTASTSDRDALQKILEIEDRRIVGDRFLIASLSHSSRRVVLASLRAIARNRDRMALESLVNLLNKKDPELKRLAAFAFGQFGDSVASVILSQHLQMQRDPTVLAAILLAIGKSGNEASVETIAAGMRDDAPDDVLDAACRALGMLWSGTSENWKTPDKLLSKLIAYSRGREPIARSAAFALSRYKGDWSKIPAPDLVAAATAAHSPETRALLCRLMGKINSTAIATFLVQEVNGNGHLAVRIEAVKALASQTPSEATLDAVKRALSSDYSHWIAAALETVNKWEAKAKPLQEVVDNLAQRASSIWVRGLAIKTLPALDTAVAQSRVNEVVVAAGSPLLPYAVEALGRLATGDTCDKLADYVASPEPAVAQAAIEGLNQSGSPCLSDGTKKKLIAQLEKGDMGIIALIAQMAERNKWKDFASVLTTAYTLLTQPDYIEAKVAVISALGAIGSSPQVELLEKLVGDPDRLVGAAAASALKSLTGKDRTPRVPASNVAIPTVPLLEDTIRAAQARYVIKTSRGDISIKMFDLAPITAYRFEQLVKKGFYTGKSFHRIVPHFVIQGGDPRGDGFGGPGFLIRDELSWYTHERGTVGIATAGPDTGGCQFFFNLAPNLHLDRNYTIFAQVTSGLELLDKMEPGDRILAISSK